MKKTVIIDEQSYKQMFDFVKPILKQADYKITSKH